MTNINNNALIDKLNKGIDITLQRLIEFKKYKKTPFVVYRDGKIMHIPAEQIEQEYKEGKRMEK